MDQRVSRTKPDTTDEIDLIELAQRLLSHWLIIVVCTVVALLAGLLTLQSAIYLYTAELKVTPAPNNPQNPISLGQLSSLASLAGLSLPNNQQATPFFLYVESVASRGVASDLAQDADLMKAVFKSEWDVGANRFVERSGWFDHMTSTLQALIGIRSYPWTPPDAARLQLYLQASVEVIEDPRKPLVTLKYDNADPAFAVAFLAALNRAIDNQLRQKTLARVNGNIAYLSKELSAVTLAEHRQALIQALSEQEKSRMAASSTGPIAAEIVNGPNASFRPTKPRPILIIAASLFAGVLLGILAALARELMTRRRAVVRQNIFPAKVA